MDYTHLNLYNTNQRFLDFCKTQTPDETFKNQA